MLLRPLIILSVAFLATAEKVSFQDYKVFRIVPQSNHQFDLLQGFEKFAEDEYNFWKPLTEVNRSVDLMVSPSMMSSFKNLMAKYDLKFQTYIENVQELIDNENPNVNLESNGYAFDRYYRLEEMYSQLEVLQNQYSSKIEIVVTGTSYEKREIRGVKLSYGPNKPIVFIEGGIHAREWISPATVMYLLHEFLTSQDPEIRGLAEAYDWYMFPSVNPDGYVYTHERFRIWRKTRTPYRSINTDACRGTDPNRNWEYMWMHGGASSHPCMENYAGPKPFSDSETRTLSEFLKTIKDDMFAYISFHSYSQLLLFPYGHTKEHLDNYDELYAIGTKTIEALSKRYGTKYVTGNIAETIYIASGSSIDYVKGTFKTPLAYTYELRDTGKHGFMLPADQIVPNGQEVMDSFIALFKEAKKFGYPKKH